jgi:hypothetical protein
MLDNYTINIGQSLSSGGAKLNAETDQREDISVPARIRIFVRASSTSNASDGAKAKFSRLEKKWKKETQFTSSLSDKYLHESYAGIIGMGPVAIPLILSSLRRSPTDWFYALRAITAANPVADQDAGDVKKMTEAWLRWGRERGLI